jgi:chromosome segregation protein
MRLKELQLYGFKSFPTKTKIQFGDGITAILGPNGCGKTNIFDALRWVLGEQGFSVLRCGKNEDLIFMGSREVLPLGYTEVALILENNDNLPEFGSEIEIKRRFYKSGESEYLLNRTPCKLRDIQDLFLNSGAGAQAYSIFDQVRQREIVGGKIRPMFEEAAAMSKYRDRKNLTERKLELTQADLIRLDDIIRERERITRSLRRQARQLEAYNKVKNEYDQIQVSLLKNRYQATLDQHQELKTRLDFLESEEKRLLLTIAAEEKRLQELKGVLKELRDQHDRIIAHRERLNYLTREQARLTTGEKELLTKLSTLKGLHAEKEKTLARLFSEVEAAKANLAQDQTGLKTEEETISARRQELISAEEILKALFDKITHHNQKILTHEAKLENLKDYVQQLSAEAQATELKQNHIREERRTLEESLETKIKAVAALEKTLAETRSSIAKKEEERGQAQKTRASIERQTGDLANELSLLKLKLEESKPPALANSVGPVFEFLKVKPGWEWTVEACLYPFIDFIVTRDGRLDFSRLNREKRFGFIFTADRSHAAVEYPAELERLKDLVEFDPSLPAFIAGIIEKVVIVNRYEDALRFSRQYPQLIFATKDGVALFPEGVVVTEATLSGKLSLRRQFDTRTEEKGRLALELNRTDGTLTELDQLLRELARQSSANNQELLSLIRARSELEGVVSAVLRNAEETDRARKRLAQEVATSRAQIETLTTELSGLKNEREQLHADETKINGRIAALEGELHDYETGVKTRLAELNSRLLAVAQLEERKHTLETEIGYLVKDETETQHELTALTAELGRVNADRQTIDAELRKAGGEGGNLPDLTNEADGLENELANNRTALETIRDELVKFRVQHYEREAECKRMEKEAAESYHADLRTFEITFEGDLNERLGILVHRLEILGRANPLAGEEFKREKDELDRLQTQRADVLGAKENLTKTIAEIDERVKDQFLSTFSAVRSAFQELFVEIFGEGEADLILSDAANVWESEIKIVARPRGKNLKRIEQLSDGEKALLAICLLFAFYKVRPAPFCFIDEIDAPLDDANVVRFSEFLKELSKTTQIVIITHNQVTVEHADVLFGVTMEKPGISKIVSVRLKDFKDAVAPVSS